MLCMEYDEAGLFPSLPSIQAIQAIRAMQGNQKRARSSFKVIDFTSFNITYWIEEYSRRKKTTRS